MRSAIIISKLVQRRWWRNTDDGNVCYDNGNVGHNIAGNVGNSGDDNNYDDYDNNGRSDEDGDGGGYDCKRR